MSGTVHRRAEQLVHLQTERETFVVTPEHPFATPEGWIAARELSPGDRVISARFGAVRVSAAHRESLPRPVPVFNLTVDRSHAYLVGTDHVLVHNTGCKESPADQLAAKNQRREEIERDLESLENRNPETPEEAARIRKEIEELRAEHKTLGAQISRLKYRLKPPEQRKRVSAADKARALEEARRELEALEQSEPESVDEAVQRRRRIAEINAEVSVLREWPSRKPYHLMSEGAPEPEAKKTPERAPNREELAKQLEDATAELRMEEQRSRGETDLERRINELTYELQKEDERLALERKREELEATRPTTDEARAQLERDKQALDVAIRKLKRATQDRMAKRRRYAEPAKKRPEPAPSREELAKQLEDATAELRKEQGDERERLPQRSGRAKTDLERRVNELTYELQKEDERLALEKKREELEATQPTTDEARAQLERDKQVLDAAIHKLKRATQHRMAKRRRYAEPAKKRPEPAPNREELAKQLEDATAELRRKQGDERERLPQRSRGKTDLERRVNELTYELQKEDERLALEKKREELEATQPTTGEARAQLERDKQALDAAIQKLKRATRDRMAKRKRYADPAKYAKVLVGVRSSYKRVYRHPDYVGDPNRAPDGVDLLEKELADLQELPASPRRDELVEHISQRLEILHRIVELRKERIVLKRASTHARRKRREMVRDGKDTTAIDHSLAEHDVKLRAVRAKILAQRTQELLLASLEETTWFDGPRPEVDRARLEEIQRELGLGGDLDEGRLSEYERELGDSEIFSADYFDEIWQHAQEESSEARAIREQEGRDVDETLRLIDELLATMPSPARTTEIQTSLARLQNELREEREQFQVNDIALYNEYRIAEAALAQPGTSGQGQGRAELDRIQSERTRLRLEWHDRMQARLQSAREQLRLLQSAGAARDTDMEADLAQEIALIEHEIDAPPFS